MRATACGIQNNNNDDNEFDASIACLRWHFAVVLLWAKIVAMAFCVCAVAAKRWISVTALFALVL